MLCRLCGNPGKFVKAHAIPEAFFRVLRAEGETPLIVSNTANTFPKRSPIGVYDEGILCDQCEPLFDHIDDYGSQVLLNRFHEFFQPLIHADKTVAFQATDVDQKLLLRFLIATLWRASVSTHIFYKRVSLGPFEDVARRVILSPQDSIPEEFSAVLSRWTSEEAHRYATTGLMNPFREKWGGVNAYRVSFGEVVSYIKVDSRPLPSTLRDLSLLAQPTVTLVARDFSKSKDFAAMVHTAKQSHQHQEEARHARRKHLV